MLQHLLVIESALGLISERLTINAHLWLAGSQIAMFSLKDCLDQTPRVSVFVSSLDPSAFHKKVEATSRCPDKRCDTQAAALFVS